MEIVDANGCVKDTTISLDEPPQFFISIDGEIEIVLGDQTTLIGSVNIPPNEILSIQWTLSDSLSCDTCLTTIANPIITTTYTLTITDIYGCEESVQITIRVNSVIDVYVPNIFSPNDDGVNESVFVSTGEGIEKINKLLIFDRWGNLVFKNENFLPNLPEEGWDGSFNGKEVNAGVFVYLVEVQLIDGGVEQFDGTITVVK